MLKGKEAFKASVQLLDQRNNEGKTAFFLAVELNNEEIIDFLLTNF